MPAEWQDFAVSEAKEKHYLLGKGHGDLRGGTGEFVIFLLWHRVQVGTLVPKLFMGRGHLWQQNPLLRMLLRMLTCY